MLRLSLQNLVARRKRVAATAVAIVLGIAFLAGTFVLTDTLDRTFKDVFADINRSTDVQVRSKEKVETQFGDLRSRLDASVVDLVRGVDGVAVAEGGVSGYAQLVDKKGDPMGNPARGAPTLGIGWPLVEELNPMRLVTGRAPSAPDEIVIDKGSADKAGFAVGDAVTVLVQSGPQQMRVVGIAKFGSIDSPLGATLTLFEMHTAQLLVGEPDKYDGVAAVARPGVSQEQLRERVAAVLPTGLEAITGRELTDETNNQIEKALGFFNTFLLVFAGVALFVAVFIIYNTFSIVVAQRTRELALLRALGARRSQVVWSVELEAVIVGLLASVVGIAGGFVVAAVLKSLLAGLGLALPKGAVVFRVRTLVVSLVVGTGVTMGAALLPALRASSVAPLAAMRAVTVEKRGHFVSRLAVGGLLAGGGVVWVLVGVLGSGDNRVAQVGLGAAAVFVGAAVLAPVLVLPIGGGIGRLVERTRGVAGELAHENAVRNPRRTATAASALMIGVGLVSFVTIFASSARASIDKIIDDSFVGDFIIDSGSYGAGGLSTELAKELNASGDVAAASGVRLGFAEVDGSSTILYSIDPATMPSIVDIGVVAGRIEDLTANDIAVHDETARDKGWKIGDTVTMRFATGARDFTIRALYTESQLAGNYVIAHSAYEQVFPNVFDFQVYVTAKPGTSVEDTRAAIERVASKYANAKVEDLTQYKDAQAAQINQLLGLVYAMLALSVVIATIGIANTLALSILERTREIGLLRAVGASSKQLRSAIRWESIIIALLGAVLGLGIGVFFGWAGVRAFRSQGFTELRLPIAQLAVVVLFAMAVGAIAAASPARRVRKLDILRAISAE